MVLAETTGEDSIFYLHGLDLVAQSDGANTEYFAYDGLGSVRQVVDDAAHVLLAQTYDPYGGVYASVGAGDTRFGFTGEQVDASGLVYLRARYYHPSMGRFLNADPSRQEMNPYMYGMGNPVVYTDPSGFISVTEAEEADVIRETLEREYNVIINRSYGWLLINHNPDDDYGDYTIDWYDELPDWASPSCGEWVEGNWRTVRELEIVQEAVEAIAARLGGKFRFGLAMGQVEIVRVSNPTFYPERAWQQDNRIRIVDATLSPCEADPNFPCELNDYSACFVITHEFGHIWDWRHNYQISSRMSDYIREEDPVSDYRAANSREDWAETFASYVNPYWASFMPVRDVHTDRRAQRHLNFIEVEVCNLTQRHWNSNVR